MLTNFETSKFIKKTVTRTLEKGFHKRTFYGKKAWKNSIILIIHIYSLKQNQNCFKFAPRLLITPIRVW